MKNRTPLPALSVLALVIALVLSPLQALAAPSSLTITQQPQDVSVEYPGQAIFHVEVSDPGQVASYQWVISDGYSDFVLTGVSASTDTLIMPSTQQDDPDLYARCVITDSDGNTVESEQAVMHILNPDESKPVLYVGDFAVEPGQTLDLALTTLGTGMVTFDANGTDITLDNVALSTETMTYDAQISPAFGLYLVRRDGEALEYYVHLVGDNTFTNTFYDADYNAAGIVFNSFFHSGDDPNAPTIIICGDGTLTLEGGSYAIYSDGNIEVDAALTTRPNGDIYNDGIVCRNIFLGDGARIDMTVNGTALRAKSDLRIGPGASIAITSTAPHVSVGVTAKNIIYVDGSIYVDDSTLSVKGVADPEQFVPYGAYLVNFCGIVMGGNLNVNASDISIEMVAGEIEDPEDPFVISLYGISYDGDSSSVILSGASKLAVTIDTPEVPVVGGLIASGILEADAGSEIVVKASSSGETAGVEADRLIELTDATLECEVRSSGGVPTYGVVCGGFSYELTEGGHHLTSVAEGGIALAADTGEHGDFTVERVEGYVPEKIVITGEAAIVTPADGEVNLHGVPGYGMTIKAETVFDPSDPTTPASELRISVPGDSGGTSGDMPVRAVIVAVVAVAAIALVVVLARRGRAAKA